MAVQKCVVLVVAVDDGGRNAVRFESGLRVRHADGDRKRSVLRRQSEQARHGQVRYSVYQRRVGLFEAVEDNGRQGQAGITVLPDGGQAGQNARAVACDGAAPGVR